MIRLPVLALTALCVAAAPGAGARAALERLPAAQDRAAGTPPGDVGPRPNVGPANRPRIDPAAVSRGRVVWATDCITCHGTQARGSAEAPSLLRSELMLRDRDGDQLGPFLAKGHPTQSGRTSASIPRTDLRDLMQFLRQQLNDTLRGAVAFAPQEVRVGNAASGQAYFTGKGGCSACHTAASRSLAGIAARVTTPSDLQQRFLFPPRSRGGGPGRGAADPPGQPSSAVIVTMTPPTGPAVSGVLVDIDDFFVTYRDASGVTRVVRRPEGARITIADPLAEHRALLDRITDTEIHDLVAFLETMK